MEPSDQVGILGGRVEEKGGEDEWRRKGRRRPCDSFGRRQRHLWNVILIESSRVRVVGRSGSVYLQNSSSLDDNGNQQESSNAQPSTYPDGLLQSFFTELYTSNALLLFSGNGQPLLGLLFKSLPHGLLAVLLFAFKLLAMVDALEGIFPPGQREQGGSSPEVSLGRGRVELEYG